MKKDIRSEPVKLESNDLALVTGGRSTRDQRPRYVSAFYCEYCEKTIHLNAVYSLDRAKKEHNAKFHQGLK